MPFQPREIRDRVGAVGSLPTLPGVVTRLLEIVEEEQVSTQEIGRIIASDQVISSRLLRIVNSSFYGFPGRITTITHALVLLGFNVVKGLVVSAAVIDILNRGMVGLWEHSIGTATASGIVARHIQMPDPEEASVAGLLHDLGKVILTLDMKDALEETEAYIAEENCSMYEAERAVMGGASHAEIGGWVAEEWNLPLRLREAMRHHHNPMGAEFEPQLAAVVHVGNAICRGLNFGSGGDPFVPSISEEAFALLGLDWREIPGLIDNVDLNLEEVDSSEFAS